MLRRRAKLYPLPGYQMPKRGIPEPESLTPQGRQMLTWGKRLRWMAILIFAIFAMLALWWR